MKFFRTLSHLGTLNSQGIVCLRSTLRHMCACWLCLSKHMQVPYVYKGMLGVQLVNRLFTARRTHTCQVNSMPNPCFAHQATLLHLTSILHLVVTLKAHPNQPQSWPAGSSSGFSLLAVSRNFHLNLVF